MNQKTKFASMLAGRDMDKLVAMKALGWRPGPNNFWLGKDGPTYWIVDEKEPTPGGRFWRPSEQIEGAWLVWRFLRETPEKFSMFIQALFTLSDRFEGDCDIDGLFTRLDPELICQAALLSLEL